MNISLLRNALLLASLLSFSAPRATAQTGGKGKKDYQIAAVAFYNLENFFNPADDPTRNDEDFTPTGPYNYTDKVYREKCHNMAFALSKLATEMIPDGPAMYGLAEIEDEQVLKDLVAQPELKSRNLKYVYFQGPDMRGINVAFLYNPHYFRLLDAESLKVNLQDSGEVKSGGTRDVLHVTGVLMGTDTVHAFVNHWPSRRGGEAASAPLRATAAGVGKKKIEELQRKNPNVKVVLMGDLNDDPTSPSVTRVLGATGDRKKLKPTGLYNPWVTFYNNGIGTLGYNDAWNLFDQIIISAPWLDHEKGQWHYYKAEVFNRDFLVNKFGQYKGYPHRSFDGNNWISGYSDHFPTLVYVVKEVK